VHCCFYLSHARHLTLAHLISWFLASASTQAPLRAPNDPPPLLHTPLRARRGQRGSPPPHLHLHLHLTSASPPPQPLSLFVSHWTGFRRDLKELYNVPDPGFNEPLGMGSYGVVRPLPVLSL
jgi:hypothetical protein